MAWFPLVGSSSNETTYVEEEEAIILNPAEWTTSDLKEESLVKAGSKIEEVLILS